MDGAWVVPLCVVQLYRGQRTRIEMDICCDVFNVLFRFIPIVFCRAQSARLLIDLLSMRPRKCLVLRSSVEVFSLCISSLNTLKALYVPWYAP